MRPSNVNVWNGTVGTSTLSVSSAIYAWDIVRASFQVSVSSGTFNGTFNVQFSNDIPVGVHPGKFQPTSWSNISSVTVVASVSATTRVFAIQQVETSYNYMRVVFVDATGGAALGVPTVNMHAKAL